MGMIQTILKACKPEADAAAYEQKLFQQANSLRCDGDEDGDRPEGVAVIRLTENNFEQYWNEQENIRKEPDLKTKYHQRAKEGRAWVIEIDW